MEITKEEQNAINSLVRLGKRWPETLWLFAGSGGLNVMKKNGEGEKVTLSNDGVDPDYMIGLIDIDSDGGDW